MFRGNIFLAALLWLIIAFLVLYPLGFLVQESFYITGTEIAGTETWGLNNERTTSGNNF